MLLNVFILFYSVIAFYLILSDQPSSPKGLITIKSCLLHSCVYGDFFSTDISNSIPMLELDVDKVTAKVRESYFESKFIKRKFITTGYIIIIFFILLVAEAALYPELLQDIKYFQIYLADGFVLAFFLSCLYGYLSLMSVAKNHPEEFVMPFGVSQLISIPRKLIPVGMEGSISISTINNKLTYCEKYSTVSHYVYSIED